MIREILENIKEPDVKDIEYYMTEGCPYYAIAIYEITKYPIKMLLDEANGDIAHVFNEVSDGMGVDVKGVRDIKDIKDDFYDLEEPRIIDITVAELKTDYMGENKPLYSYSEEEIKEAKEVVYKTQQFTDIYSNVNTEGIS